ncbi:MAG: hypothetical protein AAF995_11390 [Planctomycetota bacterium]
MTAQTAQRLASGAFAACVLVGLGIGAMLLLGLPGLPRPAPIEATGVDAGSGSAPTVEIEAPVRAEWAPPSGDGRAIAARLALVDNAPRVPEPEPEQPVEPTDPGEGEGPTELGEEVRYLGMIRSGETRRAVLRIGDRQRIVAEGDRVTINGESLTLRRVRGEGVELAGGDEGQREPIEITKADRERASVTVVSGEAPSGTLTGGESGGADAGDSDLPDTPEIRRILQDHERRTTAIKERIERGLLTSESGERLLESIEQQKQANIDRALQRDNGDQRDNRGNRGGQ